MEKETATLECDVNDKDAEVEWWHDGVKIDFNNKKYSCEVNNRKRRLTIDGAKMEDHGEYKCTTKDDKTLAQLIVDGWICSSFSSLTFPRSSTVLRAVDAQTPLILN